MTSGAVSRVGISTTYTYDGVGNRTDLGAVIGTGNRLTSFNGYTMTYDNDGNLLSKAKSGFSQAFTWNALGQLTQVVTNGVTTTFGYDGWGRRVRKATGATVTRYVWAGDQVVAERDGSGNLIRQYAYYPGMDNPAVVTKADGTRYYYVMEQPGQVAGVLNANGTLADSYEYTPWGEAITTSQAYDQPLRYMARDYDAETGLYYVRARYYDPQVGRFISEDPAGLSAGMGAYVYADLSPMMSRDPFGLCPYGRQLEDGNFEEDLPAGTTMRDEYRGGSYICSDDGVWRKMSDDESSQGNVYFIGLSGSAALGVGVTGGFGGWWSDNQVGLYLKGGGTSGLESPGAALEVGRSSSRAAMHKMSGEWCGQVFLGPCVAGSASGSSASVLVGPGVGTHGGLVYTGMWTLADRNPPPRVSPLDQLRQAMRDATRFFSADFSGVFNP